MRYLNMNIPQPVRQDTYTQESFAGGLNNRSVDIRKDQATDLLNMAFSEDAETMEKRKGSEAFDALTLSSAVTFVDEYKPYNETNLLIRSTDLEVYAGSTLVGSVSGRVSGINHSGKYYFVDGSRLFVYGKFPQEVDTYTVIVGTADPNNLVLEIQSPPSGHAMLPSEHVRGVTHVDYTAKVIWYEPCENEVADTTKGANVLPLKPKYIISHNGRLFVSGSDKDNDNVFLTAVGNGYYFPVTLPMQLPPNSDQVMGLHVYDNSVLVGRREDIFAITGNTNKPNIGIELFQLRKLNTHVGFASSNAVDTVHNFMFYLGSDGNAYALQSVRADDKTLVTSIINKDTDLLKAPVNFSDQTIKDAVSIFHNDTWYVSVLNKMLVYSYLNKGFTIYEGLNARCFHNFDGALIWGNSSGKTMKQSVNYLDDGKPFHCFWSGEHIHVGFPHFYKQFFEFTLASHVFNSVRSDVRVTLDIDFQRAQTAKYAFSNQISIFGKAKWGDRFISQAGLIIGYPQLIGRRGRYIRFTFSNWYPLNATFDNIAARDASGLLSEETLVYVTDVDKYFLRVDGQWVEMTMDDMNQAMKIYQLHLDYEMRGKR